jgi:hypothetical protein
MLLVWNCPQFFTTTLCLASEAISMPLVPKCLHHGASMDGLSAPGALPQVLPLSFHWFFANYHNWWAISNTCDEPIFTVFIVRSELHHTARTESLVRAHAYTCDLEGLVEDTQAMSTAGHPIVYNKIFYDLLGACSHASEPQTLATLSSPATITGLSLIGAGAISTLMPNSTPHAKVRQVILRSHSQPLYADIA